MGVDLLLVFGLEDEDDLYGDEIVRVITVWEDELRRSVDRNLSGVLEMQELDKDGMKVDSRYGPRKGGPQCPCHLLASS